MLIGLKPVTVQLDHPSAASRGWAERWFLRQRGP